MRLSHSALDVILTLSQSLLLWGGEKWIVPQFTKFTQWMWCFQCVCVFSLVFGVFLTHLWHVHTFKSLFQWHFVEMVPEKKPQMFSSNQAHFLCMWSGICLYSNRFPLLCLQWQAAAAAAAVYLWQGLDHTLHFNLSLAPHCLFNCRRIVMRRGV